MTTLTVQVHVGYREIATTIFNASTLSKIAGAPITTVINEGSTPRVQMRMAAWINPEKLGKIATALHQMVAGYKAQTGIEEVYGFDVSNATPPNGD